MSKDEEGPRNIKLVRYTHPGSRAWKDGLERSKSLPVQDKRKGDGRLLDMLKSRSAKFHNITMGNASATVPKGERGAVPRERATVPKDRPTSSKNRETFFLPTRTPNSVRTSRSMVHSLNLDKTLIPGGTAAPSFTSSVKQMLKEHQSVLGSVNGERDMRWQDRLRDDGSARRTDELGSQQKPNLGAQGDMGQLAPNVCEPQPREKLSEQSGQTKEIEKSGEVDGERDDRNSQVSSRRPEIPTPSKTNDGISQGEKSSPESPNGRSSDGISLNPATYGGTQVLQQNSRKLPELSRPETARSNLLRLFSQVDKEIHTASSDSNARVLKYLTGRAHLPEETSGEPVDNHSLQGCVVAFEGELGSAEDSGTSKLQVVYLSDDEEGAPKRRKVVAPPSSVLKPSSPGRMMPTLTDPSAEKRKNDREIAIDVLTKLKDKRIFDRRTISELIEKGVAEHRALEGNPLVSVTNDVCSVNNYETSHAYYYQQLDKRSKLSWIPLHAPATGDRQSPKEIWRNELQASLVSCCIFFYSVEPSKLSQDQKLIMEHQITQLKRILQTRFLVKLADSLDKKVQLVILYGQNEKLLSELVQKRLEKTSFRVWSLQRALDFLKDIDVDLEEWGIQGDPQDREPIEKEPIEKEPIEKEPIEKEPIEKEPIEKEPIEKEPIEKEPIEKEPIEKEPIEKEPIEKEPIEKEPIEKEPIEKEPIEKEPIEKEPIEKEPIEKEPIEKEPIEKEPIEKEPIEKEPIEKEPIEKEPIEKETTQEEPIEKEPTQKETTQEETTQEEPAQKEPNPKEITPEEPTEKEPSEEPPNLPNRKLLVKIDTDNKKEKLSNDVEELDSEDEYVKELLQQASNTLDKRDNELRAAHKIILALSKDAMKQQLRITSLTGRLKNSETELQNQRRLTDQYRLCMAEQELEMAQLRTQLSKRKSKKNSKNQFHVSKDL